ncbi:MAG: carbohydrate kinase family protein [Minisyncoccia bacterium]
MYDIITIGSATRDGFFVGVPFVYLKDKRFITGRGIGLPLGAKIRVPKVYFLTGGGATNTALTFSRLGFKTLAIFRVGEDVSGKTIINEMIKEGVDISFIQKDYVLPTAYSVIFLTKFGERTILSYKGCTEYLNSLEIPFKKLKAKWLFLGSLGKEKNILKKIIFWAKKEKMKIAINPGKNELEFLKKNKKYFSFFDVFIVNQEEAAYLTNIAYQKEKEIFKKLDKLVNGIVIMTKGKNGVVISDGKFLYKAPSYSFKKPKDHTGAGDAFASAFISVLMKRGNFKEKTLKEAITFASLNANSVIQYLGAKTGILYHFIFPKSFISKIKKIKI